MLEPQGRAIIFSSCVRRGHCHATDMHDTRADQSELVTLRATSGKTPGAGIITRMSDRLRIMTSSYLHNASKANVFTASFDDVVNVCVATDTKSMTEGRRRV